MAFAPLHPRPALVVPARSTLPTSVLALLLANVDLADIGSNFLLPEPAPSGYVIVGDADVVWVDRKNDGEALVQAVTSSAFDASDHFGKDPAQIH